jgi:periplasmic divalent cation tolerance protein
MLANDKEFVQVSVTAPDRQLAEKIAGALVVEKLAACAQVTGPITSFFWWEGKVDNANEYLIILKTKTSLLVPIREVLRRLHPYQVPELIALPITSGSPDYLQWLAATLG